MSLGLSSKLNVLRESPHDLNSPSDHAAAPPDAESSATPRWVPSRYTVRAATIDGRLVLWNTFSGELSVFPQQARSRIEGMLRPDGIEGRRKGAIEFLAERGFLIPAGTNEYQRFQYAFGRQHHATDRLQLILLASEDCNFRCTYCYEEFARGTMAPAVRTGIKRYLDQRITGLRQLNVEWFGGEPLYGLPAIEEIAPYASRLAEEHGVSFLGKVTTNGYLLTPDIVDKLLSWRIIAYQVTIDGPPEHHDRSRPTRDGRETFAVIFENLVAMKRRPDPFGVNLRVNFDHDNVSDLGKFLDLAEREFRDDDRFRLAFRPVGRWGGPNDPQLNICGADESMDVQLRLWEEARRRGLHLSDSIHKAKGLGAQVCYAARPYSFVIGATGKVMKCTIDLDMKDRNVVGQIDEAGRMQLNDDKMALWTEPAFESDTKCQKCVILPVCQGLACPLHRWERHESPCPTVRKTFKVEMRRAAGDLVCET